MSDIFLNQIIIKELGEKSFRMVLITEYTGKNPHPQPLSHWERGVLEDGVRVLTKG